MYICFTKYTKSEVNQGELCLPLLYSNTEFEITGVDMSEPRDGGL